MIRENRIVCSKMITGAESGGQVYGAGKWDYVKLPKIGKEVTLTLGAYQFYGNEGRALLSMIDQECSLPAKFKRCLNFDWVKTKWVPPAETLNSIGKIISSDLGIQKQMELFIMIQLPEYIKHAEEFGVTYDRAQMMWVEIEHVGGLKASKRIFRRCNGDYSLDKIMWSLKQDQYDESSDNQAGDELYWSRHLFCRWCIEKYAVFAPSDGFDGIYLEVQ